MPYRPIPPAEPQERYSPLVIPLWPAFACVLGAIGSFAAAALIGWVCINGVVQVANGSSSRSGPPVAPSPPNQVTCKCC